MQTALTGTRFGRYHVTAEIARGSVYDLYRATDAELGREVALRVFGPTWGADEGRFLDFLRDLRPLVSLDHPHIAKVYGFEEVAQTTALATELLEGPTLADVIASRSQPSIATGASGTRGLPIEEACPLAAQIVDALAAAHECGVAHGNLSPSTISICNGVVRVRNFGFAQLIPPEALRPWYPDAGSADVLHAHGLGIVLPGSALAWPLDVRAAYLSPEQRDGKPADARTDIWAFGCVFFEMLTGEPALAPVEQNSPWAGLPSLSPRWAGPSATLPVALRATIAGCVSADPADRIGDLSRVLPALRDPAIAIGALDPALVHAAEAATPEPEGRPRRSGRSRP
ncbi:MAG: prkC 8 [Chloroflexi bacterium]|nr:prkC 8 [Chloroflexota bacterium]